MLRSDCSRAHVSTTLINTSTLKRETFSMQVDCTEDKLSSYNNRFYLFQCLTLHIMMLVPFIPGRTVFLTLLLPN
jgi:hypothetical protein